MITVKHIAITLTPVEILLFYLSSIKITVKGAICHQEKFILKWDFQLHNSLSIGIVGQAGCQPDAYILISKYIIKYK